MSNGIGGCWALAELACICTSVQLLELIMDTHGVL